MNVTILKGSEYFAHLHNTGGAHGHKRSANLAEFKKRLAKAWGSQSTDFGLYSVTNSGQTTERGFLKELGFSSFESGGLTIHTLSRAQLLKVLKEELGELEELFSKWRAEDEADGRKPGELRPGDKVWCSSSKYTIGKVTDEGVHYVAGWLDNIAKVATYSWDGPIVAGTFTRDGRVVS